jgi:putative colanic acid biosynthesis UDP-glucose lipid carrier transferase
MTYVAVSAELEFQQTLKFDCRVTRVGQFLRRTNLDEMLQFINVLVGDMTLVGPRPHALAHDATHWSSSAYRARYLVKPGITGLAQIRGARGATIHPQSMNHRVRYDHLYINKQTFVLDMKICVATVMSTLQGDTNAW